VIKLLKKINWPTRITVARIAILPLILFFYIGAVSFNVSFFSDWGRMIAAILFVVAAATDWLDGFIARKYNMVTTTGKFLDPVADKLLTLLGFILILADPIWYYNINRSIIEPTTFAFTFWFAVLAVFIAIGRDVVMNSLRFIAAERGITIAADGLGKIKSTLQYIAITLYMLLAFNLNHFMQFVQAGIWLDLWAFVAMFILAAATVLSIWSCVNYIKNYTDQISSQAKEKENTQDGNE